uniref:Transposon protein, putative, CACTA, En/Spm sub-class n=1 Tax=Oryza sativa subsp. japonica TaxID=39947 RepID=Q2QN64_ORYSJ|nr:transposon protein, putative, CACTA, En/Spm sub-class [Oryza sativa Japonica Group]
MEEDEVEDDNIPDFAQYAGFEGNQTGEDERDADGNDVVDDLGQMLQDAKEDCESEKGAHKLDKMLEDHRTSLYPGCEQGHKKLDATLEFLQWKAKNGVSDKAFGDLLRLVKNILPKRNKLPETTYEAEKIVCPLGLNKGNARMMRWHAEEHQQDGMLRHPADGSQWRNIDRKFKDFGKDARNIWFGLSTDGMNPFGEMSSGHSTWPVTMCIYNLPPWLCMKRKYIMMPIIIQGPKQPGNDIDVYLRPLAPAPTPPQAPTPTPPQAPRPAPSKSRAPQAPPPAPTRATKKAKVDAAKNKDPGYDCTQEELDAYVASEVRRQLKPRSPEKNIPIDPSVRNFFRGMSAPAKEAIKLSDYERTLKKASSGKSKPVPQLGEQPNQEIEPLVTGEDFGIQEFINDTGLTTNQLLRGAPIEKAEVKYMYELGKPLVKPEQLQSLPTQMYKFHQLYMEMSATGREMIGARIRDTDFLQGDDILWINFKGIYELYQLDALDVSIMSCWILMDIQRARRRGVFDTGFIDPRKVNVAMLNQYPQATEDNLIHLLKAHHYKTFVLLPYNTEFHWVLLLFDLEACTVNVYDSMDKKESTFDNIFELIDRAWYRFRHLVRGKWRERLRWKFNFPCAKQKQGTNLCGYYVCEYCHCLADQIITTRELDFIRMRDNLTHKEFIAAVQEQLMGFINEQILDPKGEFYYDGNTIHRSLASEITTTTTSKS